jgi:hypothetical protein
VVQPESWVWTAAGVTLFAAEKQWASSRGAISPATCFLAVHTKSFQLKNPKRHERGGRKGRRMSEFQIGACMLYADTSRNQGMA